MIVPSIGRVVWFQPAHFVGARDLAQPFAALVAYVHSDRCINVGAFDANGTPFAACSVALLQDDDPIPAGGYYATWMPYQKAVAKGEIPPTLHAEQTAEAKAWQPA
jgi:hypothetical protein